MTDTQELKEIKHLMADHNEADNRRFGAQGEDLKEIKIDVKEIKANHLTHLEVELTRASNNVDWLMRFHWIVITASVGALLMGIINFLHR